MKKSVWIMIGILAFGPVGLAAADGAGKAEALRAKVATLEAQIAMKKALVRQTWKEVARLDRIIAQAAPPQAEAPPAGPDEVAAGTERSESLLDQSYERSSYESQRQQTLQGLVATYKEISLLEDEAHSARALVGRRPLLEGDWTLTFLPAGAGGQVSMSQNGTLVDGVYTMDSGLSGNVQGTFINGQMIVERIDSKYGKMGRIEGQITKDGSRIQGSWYSYDLQSGNPLTGSFTMEKIEAEPE